MKPVFYKLSHGLDYFSFHEFMSSIRDSLVYVHQDTAAKVKGGIPQGEAFESAEIGDYFYLTYGNQGVYLLGQFSGPPNIFSKKGEGWVDRPYRLIALARQNVSYSGQNKWWAPNHRSTFIKVKDDEVELFESEILEPFFDISLKNFGVVD